MKDRRNSGFYAAKRRALFRAVREFNAEIKELPGVVPGLAKQYDRPDDQIKLEG